MFAIFKHTTLLQVDIIVNEVRVCKKRERWAKNKVKLEWKNSISLTNLNLFYQTKSQNLESQ